MSDELGYRHYGTVGGDVGSPVAQLLALTHPEAVVGVHLTDIGWHNTNATYPDLTPAEQQYLAAGKLWDLQEGAYFLIQATKPQTLAYGLNDSPAGLGAWIVEKLRAWSDCQGDIERSYTKDELLTNIMIYWVTQTINTSIRTYYEDFHHPSLTAGQRIEVPVGLALFPQDHPQGAKLPRTLAERSFRIERWTEMPRGGHFAALEEPELLVETCGLSPVLCGSQISWQLTDTHRTGERPWVPPFSAK
jgi:pimeloyl-ACP methyl ester carboxylesterase